LLLVQFCGADGHGVRFLTISICEQAILPV
jgi:hypothetical protein